MNKYKTVCIKLNTDTDNDIIKWLEDRKIKKSICHLIRKEIRKERESKQEYYK